MSILFFPGSQCLMCYFYWKDKYFMSQDIQSSCYQTIDQLFHRLVTSCIAYNPGLDKKRVIKAYKFAKIVHQNVYRDSGEPYIIHPLHTALILSEYFADEDTIIAALLHDTIEDVAHISFSSIKHKFGNDVAHLVEGVTKIDDLFPKYQQSLFPISSGQSVDIETIRKVFQKSENDIRIILIKLADRVHNVRTLETKKEGSKREDKAEETLNIFSKIAARLGIWKMTKELEDLCFPYVYHKDYQIIKNYIEESLDNRFDVLNKITDEIEKIDSDKIVSNIEIFPLSYLELKKKLDINSSLTVSDLLEFQIITDSIDKCYLSLRIVHQIWKKRGIEEDFISNSRDNGYQAYHTEVVTTEGYRIGFRIMTYEMYKKNWLGITYDLFQQKTLPSDSFFIPFRNINEHTSGNSEEFIDAAKTDLLSKKIKIHTKGKSVYVPNRSTALDFVFYAFPREAVFTKQIYCNDQKIPFGKRLWDGDVIRVNFSKSPNVNFTWFNQIKTAVARIAVQKAIHNWEYEKKLRIGRKILQKEFDLYEKGHVDRQLQKNKSKLKQFFGIQKKESIFILIAEGQIKAYDILSVCFPRSQKKQFKNNLWTPINVFWDNMFRKKNKGEQVRLKIEGLSETFLNELNSIHKNRISLNIPFLSSYLSENEENQTFTLVLSILKKNDEVLHDFLAALERQEGITRIRPMLSAKKQKIFIFWVLTTLFMWGTLPILLNLTRIYLTNISHIAQLLIIYLNVLPILVLNYLMYSFIRNYFPSIRNAGWLVGMAILLNLGGIIFFVSQLRFYTFEIDLYLILTIFFLSNIIILYHYVNQKNMFSKEAYIRQNERKKKYNITTLFAYFLGLIATGIWGINPLVIRYIIQDGDNTFFTVGMRLYIGFFSLFIMSQIRSLFSNRYNQRDPIKYNKYFWLMVIGLTGNFLFFHYGLKFTSASNASLLENFASIIILLMIGFCMPHFSFEIGNKRKEVMKTIAIVAVGSIGTSLVLSHSPKEYLVDYDTRLVGDLLEIVAMLFFAVFIMSNSLYMKKVKASGMQVMTEVFFFSSVLFTPFIFLQPIPKFSLQDWYGVLFMGFIATSVSYTLWTIASKKISVIPASLLLNFAAIVTIILENRLFGVSFDWTLILGILLFFMASTSAEVMNRKMEKKWNNT